MATKREELLKKLDDFSDADETDKDGFPAIMVYDSSVLGDGALDESDQPDEGE